MLGRISIASSVARLGVRVVCDLGSEPVVGTVRFVGETAFLPGIWIGVELDEPIGNHDGSLKGRQYFQCAPSHGIFCRVGALRNDRLEANETRPLDLHGPAPGPVGVLKVEQAPSMEQDNVMTETVHQPSQIEVAEPNRCSTDHVVQAVETTATELEDVHCSISDRTEGAEKNPEESARLQAELPSASAPVSPQCADKRLVKSASGESPEEGSPLTTLSPDSCEALQNDLTNLHVPAVQNHVQENGFVDAGTISPATLGALKTELSSMQSAILEALEDQKKHVSKSAGAVMRLQEELAQMRAGMPVLDKHKRDDISSEDTLQSSVSFDSLHSSLASMRSELVEKLEASTCDQSALSQSSLSSSAILEALEDQKKNAGESAEAMTNLQEELVNLRSSVLGLEERCGVQSCSAVAMLESKLTSMFSDVLEALEAQKSEQVALSENMQNSPSAIMAVEGNLTSMRSAILGALEEQNTLRLPPNEGAWQDPKALATLKHELEPMHSQMLETLEGQKRMHDELIGNGSAIANLEMNFTRMNSTVLEAFEDQKNLSLTISKAMDECMQAMEEPLLTLKEELTGFRRDALQHTGELAKMQPMLLEALEEHRATQLKSSEDNLKKELTGSSFDGDAFLTLRNSFEGMRAEVFIALEEQKRYQATLSENMQNMQGVPIEHVALEVSFASMRSAVLEALEELTVQLPAQLSSLREEMQSTAQKQTVEVEDVLKKELTGMRSEVLEELDVQKREPSEQLQIAALEDNLASMQSAILETLDDQKRVESSVIDDVWQSSTLQNDLAKMHTEVLETLEGHKKLLASMQSAILESLEDQKRVESSLIDDVWQSSTLQNDLAKMHSEVLAALEGHRSVQSSFVEHARALPAAGALEENLASTRSAIVEMREDHKKSSLSISAALDEQAKALTKNPQAFSALTEELSGLRAEIQRTALQKTVEDVDDPVVVVGRELAEMKSTLLVALEGQSSTVSDLMRKELTGMHTEVLEALDRQKCEQIAHFAKLQTSPKVIATLEDNLASTRTAILEAVEEQRQVQVTLAEEVRQSPEPLAALQHELANMHLHVLEALEGQKRVQDTSVDNVQTSLARFEALEANLTSMRSAMLETLEDHRKDAGKSAEAILTLREELVNVRSAVLAPVELAQQNSASNAALQSSLALMHSEVVEALEAQKREQVGLSENMQKNPTVIATLEGSLAGMQSALLEALEEQKRLQSTLVEDVRQSPKSLAALQNELANMHSQLVEALEAQKRAQDAVVEIVQTSPAKFETLEVNLTSTRSAILEMLEDHRKDAGKSAEAIATLHGELENVRSAVLVPGEQAQQHSASDTALQSSFALMHSEVVEALEAQKREQVGLSESVQKLPPAIATLEGTLTSMQSAVLEALEEQKRLQSTLVEDVQQSPKSLAALQNDLANMHSQALEAIEVQKRAQDEIVEIVQTSPAKLETLEVNLTSTRSALLETLEDHRKDAGKTAQVLDGMERQQRELISLMEIMQKSPTRYTALEGNLNGMRSAILEALTQQKTAIEDLRQNPKSLATLQSALANIHSEVLDALGGQKRMQDALVEDVQKSQTTMGTLEVDLTSMRSSVLGAFEDQKKSFLTISGAWDEQVQVLYKTPQTLSALTEELSSLREELKSKLLQRTAQMTGDAADNDGGELTEMRPTVLGALERQLATQEKVVEDVLKRELTGVRSEIMGALESQKRERIRSAILEQNDLAKMRSEVLEALEGQKRMQDALVENVQNSPAASGTQEVDLTNIQSAVLGALEEQRAEQQKFIEDVLKKELTGMRSEVIEAVEGQKLEKVTTCEN